MTEKRHLCIATVLPAEGETGVQTHFQNFYKFAKLNKLESVRIITPYEVSKLLRGPLRRFSKLVGLYRGELGILLERQFYSLLLYWSLLTCLKLLKDCSCIIYAEDPLSGRVALRLKRKGYPIDVVLVVHYNISQAWEVVKRGIARPDGPLCRHLLRLEEEVLPQVDRLIFVSHFMENVVLERIPSIIKVPRKIGICTIPNKFQPCNREEKADIITIGTIEPRKNQQFLIKVLAEAHRLGYKYHLTIVGEGECKEHLARLTRELNMMDYVMFTGYIPNARELISGHRAYVHASEMENLPISLIEALYCGRPIFAAPVGGIPEIFEDGREGIFWNLDNPTDAAKQLIRVLEDAALYDSMSNASRERYETTFNSDVVIQKLFEAVMGIS